MKSTSVSRVLVEKNIPIPLRDGVVTYADIFRPADGDPVPGIITRTPYDKEVFAAAALPIMPSALKLAERGYAVAVQDVRGRFSSEGEFNPFVNEADDGYDSVEWLAAQPWCDGGVAIYGPSYVGATTLLAARAKPPSLKCAIPIITADDYYDGWTYQGGALQLGFTTFWGLGLAAAQALGRDRGLDPDHLAAAGQALLDPAATVATRPLAAMPGLSEPALAPWYRDWIGHDQRDAYWEALRHSDDYARYEIPMFHVGGWFDIFGIGTVRNFRGMSAASPADHHLLIGPWSHTYYDRYLGELDFGPTGSAAFSGAVLDYNRFLDWRLKGVEADLPAVRYFLMGANEWRQADQWPPAEASTQNWFLDSGGNANSARGDGALATTPAPADSIPDRFFYDPLRPVPSEGGPTLQANIGLPGPRDQSRIEARDDVLCYTSEPLAEPLVVAGPVKVVVWAVTDAPDTDFTAKLVDVHPDGRPVSLCDGILRARFRQSFTEPRPVPAGEPIRYEIDLASTAVVFAPGHCIRLEVSSSNFPRFDANPNTGESIAAETEIWPALQYVLHDEEHPSAIELSVLPA